MSSLLKMAMASLLVSISAAAAQQTSADPVSIVENAPENEWVRIAPENLMVMDLPAGPMIIELRPDLAPAHIERVTRLTRERFYDGTIFHRVIEGFVAQGGDPQGNGQGGSSYPDLPGEFAQDGQDMTEAVIIGRDDRAAQVGFLGTVPVGTQAPTLSSFLTRDVYALWGLHCQGVMSMARASSPNSANSQFFVMFGDARDSLDQGYTVWGNAVSGFTNAKRISRGEPPVRPTPIVRMRMMMDIPANERKTVEYLDPSSETFKNYLIARRLMTPDGYVENICGIDVPVRIDGELTL